MLSWRYRDETFDHLRYSRFPRKVSTDKTAVMASSLLPTRSGFRVQSRGDHGWPPLVCGMLSISSDIEGCRAVVSGVVWIRLLESARLM